MNQRVTNISELSRHVDSRIDALGANVEERLNEILSLMLHQQNQQKNTPSLAVGNVEASDGSC